MGFIKISQLKSAEPNHENLLYMVDVTTNTSRKVTIGQLLGLQQEAMNKPCSHCGSRGKYDVRVNCGACGAPITN